MRRPLHDETLDPIEHNGGFWVGDPLEELFDDEEEELDEEELSGLLGAVQLKRR